MTEVVSFIVTNSWTSTMRVIELYDEAFESMDQKKAALKVPSSSCIPSLYIPLSQLSQALHRTLVTPSFHTKSPVLRVPPSFPHLTVIQSPSHKKAEEFPSSPTSMNNNAHSKLGIAKVTLPDAYSGVLMRRQVNASQLHSRWHVYPQIAAGLGLLSPQTSYSPRSVSVSVSVFGWFYAGFVVFTVLGWTWLRVYDMDSWSLAWALVSQWMETLWQWGSWISELYVYTFVLNLHTVIKTSCEYK
jgi:hypothetical protein